MKRILSILILLGLLAAMALPGSAAETGLAVSSAEVNPGETAYLRVVLNDALKGDSIRVTYSYDRAIMKALPKSCTWEKAGATLKNFDNKSNGVWAAASAVELKGDLCVLAFQVLPSAKFEQTKISCEVVVKKGTEVVGSYTATGIVTMHCEHEFGSWKDGGNVGHVQQCGNCGKTITASHTWDQGVITENPDDDKTKLQTFTCTVCGSREVYKLPADSEETTQPSVDPTEPPVTYPTAPPTSYPTAPTEKWPSEPDVTQPPLEDEDHNGQQGDSHVEDIPDPQPTNPTSVQRPEGSESQNQGGQNGSGATEPPVEDHTGHDHTNQGSDPDSQTGSRPGTEGPQQGSAAHDHQGESTIPDEILDILEGDLVHDHDHEAEVEPVSPGVVVFAVLLCAVTIALVIDLIKNKNRI